MGMFGRSAPPRSAGMRGSYEDLPIGPPMPGKRGGLFGGALKGIGNFLMYGGPRIQEQMRADREDREMDRQIKLAQLGQKAGPSYQNIAGVGLVKIDPDSGPQIAIPSKTEEPSLIRELRAAGIDPASPEGRKIIARAASGFQYSDEAQQQRILTETAIAQARASAAARYRAPPAAAAPKLPAGFILDQ